MAPSPLPSTGHSRSNRGHRASRNARILAKHHAPRRNHHKSIVRLADAWEGSSSAASPPRYPPPPDSPAPSRGSSVFSLFASGVARLLPSSSSRPSHAGSAGRSREELDEIDFLEDRPGMTPSRSNPRRRRKDTLGFLPDAERQKPTRDETRPYAPGHAATTSRARNPRDPPPPTYLAAEPGDPEEMQVDDDDLLATQLEEEASAAHLGDSPPYVPAPSDTSDDLSDPAASDDTPDDASDMSDDTQPDDALPDVDMLGSPSTSDPSAGGSRAEDRDGPQLAQLPSRTQIYDWVEEGGLSGDEKLARRIAYLLAAGPVSCPAKTHEHWDRVHNESCSRHMGLEATWSASSSADSSRSYAEKEELAGHFGLSAKYRPLPSCAMGLGRDQLPSASRLEAMFTGWREQDRWKGAEICLHKHDVPERKMAPAAHDVDSFLHVTRDPSDFKGPLHICLSPQPNRLLSKSIHVKVPLLVGGKTRTVPIHQIPHIALAHEKFTVIYMFFPRLYSEAKGASVHLDDKQHALFFEGLIRPSFERIGTHFEHHLPANYESVKAASQIAAEATGSAATRGASVEVPYNKENLADLWAVMRGVLQDAEWEWEVDARGNSAAGRRDTRTVAQFGEPIFLLNRKDTKLLHKSRDTISSTIDGFWDHNTAAVDPYTGGEDDGDGRLQLLDVASEFMPARNGHTVLARRCCQHNTMLFLHGKTAEALLGDEAPRAENPSANEGANEGVEPSSADPSKWQAPRIPLSVTKEYNIHLLRDTVSVTCEPSKTSANFENGLYYAQSYSVLKNIFTRAGVWAFSNNDIFNLGHSAPVWDALAREGHVTRGRASGDRSLLRSCERMAAAFMDLGRGYGCRLEFRIKQSLAVKVEAAEASWQDLVRRANGLPGQSPRGGSERRLAVYPDRDSFFVVGAREFNLFLQMNIDKHLRLMDYIRSYYSRDDWNPQAAASLYAVVLAALQEFTMRHEPVLSYFLMSPLKPASEAKPGLGMLSIMERRGFAFFPEDVVDWQWLKLHNWATSLVQVPHTLVMQHWREFESLQESKHLYDQVLVLALGPTVRTAGQADDVLGILAQLLITEYKKAAFYAIFRRRAKDISSCEFTLSRLSAEVSRQQARSLAPASGNRREFKHVSTYFDWAWNDSPRFGDRNHLKSSSFRVMTMMAKGALDTMRQNEFVSADRFMAILYYRFSQQIICFPSPDKHNGCLSVTNSDRARTMICTEVRVKGTTVPLGAKLTDEVAVTVPRQGAMARPVASPYPPSVLGSIDQIRRVYRLGFS